MTSSTPRPYQVVYDTDNGLQYVFETGPVAIPEAPMNGITALTGDVTASGPGSAAATIAVGVVTTAKLADHSITPAKISVTNTDNFLFPNNVTVAGSVLQLGSGAFGSIKADTGQNLYIGTSSNTVALEFVSGGPVIINTANLGIHGAPDNSAALDVQSTTTGMLPPRMTTTQRNAIGTPAEGLIVYDTTLHALYEYQNGAWAEVGGGSSGVSSVHADSNANITGDVQLISGTNVTLSQTGQAVTINAAGGSGVVVAYHHANNDYNNTVDSSGEHIIDLSVTPLTTNSTFFVQCTLYTQLPTTGDQTSFELWMGGFPVTSSGAFSVYNANLSRIDMIVPLQGFAGSPATISPVNFFVVATAASGTDNYIGHVELFITEFAS